MEPLDVELEQGWGGLEHIYGQAGPQVPALLSFLKVTHPPHLALRLHNPPKEFSFNPQNISKASKIWTDPAVGWS